MGFFACCCTGCAVTYSGVVRVCNTLGAGVGGATVTVKDHATGAVLDTCTSAGTGSYSGGFTLASGTSRVVDVVITLGNGSVSSLSRTFVCGANTVPLLAVPTAKVSIGVSVCGTGQSGVTVSVVKAGVTQTAATDGTGTAVFYCVTGSYTYSVPAGSRYTSASGSITVNTATNCTQTVAAPVAVAAGYACLCGYPVATTLHGTLSGDCTAVTFTLTYDGVSAWVSGNFAFQLPNNFSSCWGNFSGVTLNATATARVPGTGPGASSVDRVSGDTFGCRGTNTIAGTMSCSSGPPAFAASVDFGTGEAAGVCQGGACSNAMTLSLTE